MRNSTLKNYGLLFYRGNENLSDLLYGMLFVGLCFGVFLFYFTNHAIFTKPQDYGIKSTLQASTQRYSLFLKMTKDNKKMGFFFRYKRLLKVLGFNVKLNIISIPDHYLRTVMIMNLWLTCCQTRDIHHYPHHFIFFIFQVISFWFYFCNLLDVNQCMVYQ